jgi:hypothetical protein
MLERKHPLVYFEKSYVIHFDPEFGRSKMMAWLRKKRDNSTSAGRHSVMGDVAHNKKKSISPLHLLGNPAVPSRLEFFFVERNKPEAVPMNFDQHTVANMYSILHFESNT